MYTRLASRGTQGCIVPPAETAEENDEDEDGPGTETLPATGFCFVLVVVLVLVVGCFFVCRERS